MISIKLAKEISLIKWNAELNDGDYLYELKFILVVDFV